MNGSAAPSRQRPDRDVVRAAGRRRDPPRRRAARPAGAEAAWPPTAPRRSGGAAPTATRCPRSGRATASTSTPSSASGPGPSPTPTCARSRTSWPGRTSWPASTRAGRTDGGVPRWPVSEDVDAETDERPRRSADDDRHAGPDHRVRGAAGDRVDVSRRTPGRAADDPEDHFQPPPPPPLPRDRPGRAVRVGRARSAGRCCWCSRRWPGCSSRGGSGLLAAGRLHGRLRHARRPDEGPSRPRTPARTTAPSSERRAQEVVHA